MAQQLKAPQLPKAWQGMVAVLDRIGHSNGHPNPNDCAMAGIYARTLTAPTPGGKPAIDRRQRR